ncbi:MAG TPA: ParB N-terminal domain-containing protein, partial [Anaerolineae bacterium]|nr:ParB N-terminal domain-containing protein [Anaerolineae bacterium]
MNIEQRPIAELRPHPANYNRHPEPQMAVLRESLRTHGLQKPLVIQPDGTVLAGHGLLEAAKAEGWVQIACHVYDGPYPEAFLVIDNRSAQMAEPDPQALTDLLKSLQEQGQLEMTGYGAEDLGELIAGLQGEKPADGNGAEVARQTLAERFGVPPFSVL